MLRKVLRLFNDARFVERLLGFEYGFFRRFEDGIKPTQHAHRQNDIGVLAAFEQIPLNVVGDSPDKRDNLFVCRLVPFSGCNLSKRRVNEKRYSAGEDR